MVTTRAGLRSTPATPQPAQATHASLAGSPLEIDPVSKARTITHMNRDHGDDMVVIMRHYCGLSKAEAAGARMEDIDKATMVIRTNAGVHAVAVTPPMATWGERRNRLKDMTEAARSALATEDAAEAAEVGPAEAADRAGVEDRAEAGDRAAGAAVKFYSPEGYGILSFVGVTWYFISAAFVFSGNLEDDSTFWHVLEKIHFPIGPELYTWLVSSLIVPMVIIHAAEAFYMAETRLIPHGVPILSWVFWQWVVCAFFEGAPCWWKWDKRVLGKDKKKLG